MSNNNAKQKTNKIQTRKKTKRNKLKKKKKKRVKRSKAWENQWVSGKNEIW